MQLQHELHHELLAHTLHLHFRSLLVGSSKRFGLAPAKKHAALPMYFDNCGAFASSVKFRVLLKGVTGEIGPLAASAA